MPLQIAREIGTKIIPNTNRIDATNRRPTNPAKPMPLNSAIQRYVNTAATGNVMATKRIGLKYPSLVGSFEKKLVGVSMHLLAV